MIFIVFFPMVIILFLVGLIKTLLKWISIFSIPAAIGMAVYLL